MKLKPTLYTLFLISLCSCFFVGCTKEKKTIAEVVKINKNGLPILQPLQEEMPKLTVGYINEKHRKI